MGYLHDILTCSGRLYQPYDVVDVPLVGCRGCVEIRGVSQTAVICSTIHTRQESTETHHRAVGPCLCLLRPWAGSRGLPCTGRGEASASPRACGNSVSRTAPMRFRRTPRPLLSSHSAVFDSPAVLAGLHKPHTRTPLLGQFGLCYEHWIHSSHRPCPSSPFLILIMVRL